MNLDWNWYLLICSLSTTAAVLIAGTKRLQSLLHFGPGLLGLLYITYVLRPYLAYTFGSGMSFFDLYLPGASSLVERDIGLLSLCFSSAVIFFSLGYRCLSRPYIDQPYLQSKANFPGNRVIFRDFALLLVLAGYVSFFFAQRSGIFSSGTVEYTRYAGGVVFTNTTGYIEYANYLVVSGTILWYASTRKLILSLVLASPWVINQIYSGWQRYMFLNLAIGLMVVAIASGKQTKKSTRLQTGGAILLAITALAILITMRSQRDFLQQGKTISNTVQTASSLPADALLGDFSGFEGTWYTIHTFSSVEPFFGASIIYRNFLLPIPRIIWKEKPLKAEFTWSSLMNGKSSLRWRDGLSNPDDYVWYNTAVKGSIGYALEEWGWLGIPLNFFLTGLFFAFIERRFAASDLSPAWMAAHGATYALVTMQGRNDIFEFLLVYAFIFYIPYSIIQKWSSTKMCQLHLERLATIKHRISSSSRVVF